jgi:hypothetical protein
MAVGMNLASLLAASRSANNLKEKQELMTKVVGSYHCGEDEKLTKAHFSSQTKEKIIEGVWR